MLEVAAAQAPILLLDEADASLNEERLDTVYKFLQSEQTVVLVTHRLPWQEAVALPGVRVFFLQKGRLRAA